METRPFRLRIEFDSELDANGNAGLQFEVLDANLNELNPEAPYCPLAPSICGGPDCVIPNCIQFSDNGDGYEGDLYVGVQALLEDQFGWRIHNYSYDTASAADERYVLPVVNIDVDALRAIPRPDPYEVWVLVRDQFESVIDTVMYPNILTVGSAEDTQGDQVDMELWLINPALLGFAPCDMDFDPSTTGDRNPLCIGYKVTEFIDIWNWNATLGYSPQEIPVILPAAVQTELDNLGCGGNPADDCDGDGVLNVFQCPPPPDPADADWVCDTGPDNCYAIDNPDQQNHDGDEFGDECDTDDDNDGVLDSVDNCPFVATLNGDQSDSDGNGIGDACDGTTEIALCQAAPIETDDATDFIFDPNPSPFGRWVAVQEVATALTDEILGLRVQIQATHDYVGDFQFTLQHNDGSEVQLVNSSEICTRNELLLLLADNAAINIPDQCGAGPVSGILLPAQPLAALHDNGQSVAGTWSLTVEDVFPPESDGALENWCVFVRVPDADNDGIPDSQDAPDTNGDGVNDSIDNCTEVANESQIDADGDGHANFCDADFNQTCGMVNFADLALMQAGFFTINPILDLNASGGPVNFADLTIMNGLIFAPPGPSAPGALCNFP